MEEFNMTKNNEFFEENNSIEPVDVKLSSSRPKTVGHLNFGKKVEGYYPIQFHLCYKPNWLKRFCLKYFLDLKWEDVTK